jgi:hypothetical protein
MVEDIKSILKTLFDSSGFTSFFIVLVSFLVAFLFVHALTGDVTHHWAGTYCHPDGCEADQRILSGKIYENSETKTCPPVASAYMRLTTVGKYVTAVYEDFYFVEGTCTVTPVPTD